MPSVAETLQRALTHHQQGMLGEAERIYRSVIRVDPKQADALHLLGVVQQQRGDAKSAVDYISRAVREQPRAAVFYGNLAAAQKSLGRLDDALASLDEAIRLDPDFADAHYNRGTILKDLGRPEQAVAAFQQALARDPNRSDAYNNLGIVYVSVGRLEEGLASYRKALELAPDHAQSWNNLGLALAFNGDSDDAQAAFRRALTLQPAYVQARVNLGNLIREQGDPVTAEREFREALQFAPQDTTVLNNLGVSLKDQGRFDDALALFDQVVELDEQHVEARVNRSFIHRLQGDLQRGWAEFDWRFRAEPVSRNFPQPEWTGESLNGKTLLVHVEQGIGDQILFASCVPDVAAPKHTGRSPWAITLECDERLVPLFQRSFPGVEVIPESESTPEHECDLQIPMGSLPQWVRPTLDDFPARSSASPIQQPGFLRADAELVAKWRQRFAELGNGLNVGISWRGGRDPELRRLRSVTLNALAAALAMPGVNLVNLQYGDCRAEIAAAESEIGATIHTWDDADAWNDLENFAAQIAALDLVISVDNSTVHFAGGLGVPCWVLLPFVPDWRWMLERDDSPWYPSLRLFRQPRRGDWDSVIEQVRTRLASQTETGTPAVSESQESLLSHCDSAGEEALSAADRKWLEQNAALRWHPAITSLPEHRQEFQLRRYEFARDYCEAKRVLDVACGTGYGSSLLSQAAAQVWGIDMCAEAVEFASRVYGSDRVQFRRSFAELTEFDDADFDVVVCFEALEHMLSARSAMREFARLLTSDGIAIVSVPNAWGHTRHHLIDPDLPFLESLTAEFFAQREFFYNNSGDRPSTDGAGIGPLVERNATDAECLIAVCSQPLKDRVAEDRTAAFLEDAYDAAFARHDAFLQLLPASLHALCEDESRMQSVPEIATGCRTRIELAGAECDCRRVILRMDTDVVECDSDGATVVMPRIALHDSRLAQLQLLDANDNVLAAPLVRLTPSP